MTFIVCPAFSSDLSQLEAVEMAAAQLFDGLKSTEGLQKKTVPMHQLQSAYVNGMLCVAVSAAQTLVGFLLAEKLDDDLHISEMDVIPAHGRQGIGASFL
jgi:4-diphosphocytidyl-2-C-methyl-D-erythritol kinase